MPFSRTEKHGADNPPLEAHRLAARRVSRVVAPSSAPVPHALDLERGARPAYNRPNMNPKPDHKTDVVAVLFLLATALVVSWPIVAGGYLTYADNAAHIAEIYALAFENGGGWSDIAFCGFPIGTLHSPLWYGSVAALVRAGVPAGFLYALALFIARVSRLGRETRSARDLVWVGTLVGILASAAYWLPMALS